MNSLTENIVKSQQMVSLLESDIKAAFLDANAIERPEGRTHGDNALAECLSDCLNAVRQLQGKLQRLG